jgi:hypothetical protein
MHDDRHPDPAKHVVGNCAKAAPGQTNEYYAFIKSASR